MCRRSGDEGGSIEPPREKLDRPIRASGSGFRSSGDLGFTEPSITKCAWGKFNRSCSISYYSILYTMFTVENEMRITVRSLNSNLKFVKRAVGQLTNECASRTSKVVASFRILTLCKVTVHEKAFAFCWLVFLSSPSPVLCIFSLLYLIVTS